MPKKGQFSCGGKSVLQHNSREKNLVCESGEEGELACKLVEIKLSGVYCLFPALLGGFP